MVLRCAWGTCNADERYPKRLNGGRFILFPKPKTELEKCKRWIKNCGRPHGQLNLERVNKHKAVCSSVETNQLKNGQIWFQPMAAHPCQHKNCHASLLSECPLPKQFGVNTTCPTSGEEGQGEISVSQLIGSWLCQTDKKSDKYGPNNYATKHCPVQRGSSWLDFLALTVEITSLKTELETSQQTVNTLLLENEKLKSELLEKNSVLSFGVGKVLQLQKKTKGLFVFYILPSPISDFAHFFHFSFHPRTCRFKAAF
ncbi:hypothetical protein P5673_027054 [Acropora cervicornis]|uniref:THAP-type domain-containing protein n=1 Tax=Acropora cervicornis TaxID=6130 RepID=A0AAD9UW97_ACRCE|nr:hypothetical protein P5673_027054 [Acropora cervicornis]